MGRLQGKIAVVTGGGSGIGRAIAIRFAQQGATVVVASRRLYKCEETAAAIQTAGGQAAPIQTDVSDEGQVEALISETVRRYHRIDILVNNAGIFGGRHLAQTTTEEFDHVMNTNLRGTFFCCRAGFKQMKRQGGGLIINMSSVAGVQAWTGTGTYSASKHAIMALTKALADEGRAHRIKATAICPAGVADDLVDAGSEERSRSEKIDPYDIAETALYLACLGPQAVVREIVVDRLGADW
ncbi:MAG TPA: SDR family oxidoreductase [Nitrospiraceae bacterium]|nr:SDR family oxidoreductase [Nitrospiraceae bacterium]